MSKKGKRSTAVIVPGPGPECHRCHRPTEIRQHKFITEKHLRQPFYYSRWFVCQNKNCATTQIMPDEFRVFADTREIWEEPQVELPILSIGEPSDDEVPW